MLVADSHRGAARPPLEMLGRKGTTTLFPPPCQAYPHHHISRSNAGIARAYRRRTMVTYARRTMSEALAQAKSLKGKKNAPGMCLAEVAEVFGLTGPYHWGGNGKAWAI